MNTPSTVVVIGGGAAGFFGAIKIKEENPSLHVILLEKSAQVLSKVRISGGGRCNVTHACFDPIKLTQNYPRGSKELKSAFMRFQPQDTIQWYKARNVELKTEKDGRMFPITDSSETIIQCLTTSAKKAAVDIRLEMSVDAIEQLPSSFRVHIHDQSPIECKKILIASGSNRKIFDLLKALGHTIEPLLPSLFTFNVPTSKLTELSGIAVEQAEVSIVNLKQKGPLLITHFGFSGPAVLKLSAFGAKELAQCGYKADLTINWLPDMTFEEIQKTVETYRQDHTAKKLSSLCPFSFPKSLWKKFLEMAEIDPDTIYGHISKKETIRLIERLRKDRYQVDGKTTHKEEFVTCGGVKLSEVDFKTMESRKVPGLYFAGEVLDIDGITGGFNFQNAWTTSWIAGQSIRL